MEAKETRNGTKHSRVFVYSAQLSIFFILSLMMVAVLRKFECQWFWVSLVGVITSIQGFAVWAHSASERRKTIENVNKTKGVTSQSVVEQK